MQFRDFMQKYRPLYSPDEPAAPAADSVATAPVAEAAPAAEAAASAAPAAAEAAPAAEAAAAPVAEAAAADQSLLEAASSKPPAAEAKPEGDAAAAAQESKPADGEAKPEAKDAKPEGDKKPEAATDPKDTGKTEPDKKDATAEAQPPAPVKYDAFKLPEGAKFDDERFSKFTEIAGAGQVAQAVAQQLLDLHIGEMTKYADQVKQEADKHQRDVWKGLNDTWKADFRKDPQLGGNREQTSLAMAKAVLEEYGGTPDQVKDLLAHTKANGMGNYTGFIRLLANIGEALNVFESSEAEANPSAPKIPRSRGERWYGGNGATKQ